MIRLIIFIQTFIKEGKVWMVVSCVGRINTISVINEIGVTSVIDVMF